MDSTTFEPTSSQQDTPSPWDRLAAQAQQRLQSWRRGAEDVPSGRYLALVAFSGLVAATIAIWPFAYPLLATARGQADPVNAALMAQPRGGLRRALLQRRANEVQAQGSYGTEAIGKVVLYGHTLAAARDVLANAGSPVPSDALLAAVTDALDARIPTTSISALLEKRNDDVRIASLDSATVEAWSKSSDTSSTTAASPALASEKPQVAGASPIEPALAPGVKLAPVSPVRVAPVPPPAPAHVTPAPVTPAPVTPAPVTPQPAKVKPSN